MTRAGDDATVSTSAPETVQRNLLMRVLAALVLLPLAIGALYAGGVIWAALVTAIAVGLYLEWLSVIGASARLPIAIGVVTLLAASAALLVHRADLALALTLAGSVAVAVAAQALRVWSASGVLYAAAALIAALVIRRDADMGFAALLFVLAIVWVTDILGYFAGRGIGGPKLWVRVSPKKTWAGAIGGFLGSLVVAAIAAKFGLGQWPVLLLLGALLSVISQAGDLFESAVKRNFGVKDSSHVIPGHGGLMDRLDGVIAALAVAALIGVMRGGLDGAGRGLLVW